VCNITTEDMLSSVRLCWVSAILQGGQIQEGHVTAGR